MNNNDNKLLYYYPTLELFKTKLAANQVNDTAINLIQDKGILYTRGTYINLSDILISNDAPTDDQLLWVDMSADGESVSEKIYIGTTEPTNGQLLWINPDTNEIKYNNNGTWTAIGGGVEEAPIDGNGYVRKDGEWTDIDVKEAPIDGNSYVRKDGTWTTVDVEEAPIDNLHYVRYNGEWAVVDGGVEEAPIDGLYYARKDGEWIAAGNCPITLIAETDTSDSTDVANIVFTVTIDEVSQLVSNGSTIIVEYGRTVKIKSPRIGNYFTPALIEFTTELFLSYTKTFIYKQIPLGVYILDKNGELWTTDQWNTSNSANANAIAVLTNNVKVLVALREYGSYIAMASSDQEPIWQYCTAIGNETAAKADYKGKENTANILKTVSSTDYAAGWANAFTFPDGTKGHLPSLGEFWEVYQNKAAVDAALVKCSGVPISDREYWCSTYWGILSYMYPVCWSLNWEGGLVYNTILNSTSYARAFAVYNP